jgi:hypothetical protein
MKVDQVIATIDEQPSEGGGPFEIPVAACSKRVHRSARRSHIVGQAVPCTEHVRCFVFERRAISSSRHVDEEPFRTPVVKALDEEKNASRPPSSGAQPWFPVFIEATH